MEQAPGTAGDSPTSQTQYHAWQLPDRNISVRLRLDVAERLEREVICAYKSIPKRGAEAGGLLLGRIEPSDSVSIVIDDFAAVRCEHRRGPSYFLSESDVAGLEAKLKRHGKSVVGFYRSHTRQDFGLDDEDRTRVRTYLTGPASAFLLIKPLAISNCLGNLFFWDGREIHTDRSWVEFPFGKWQLTPEVTPERANSGARVQPARTILLARHVDNLNEVEFKDQGHTARMSPAVLTLEKPSPLRRTRWVPIAACLMFALSALLGLEIWNRGPVQNKPFQAVVQSQAPAFPAVPIADSGATAVGSITASARPARLSAVAQPQQPLTGRSRLKRDITAAHKGKARSKKRGISRHRLLRKAHHQRRDSPE